MKSEFRRRLAGKSWRMIPHRHGEQLRGGHKAGKGGDPEIKPQRRENDEDEISQRRCETQRLRRSHPVHMQIQRERRKAGFDQGGHITPQRRDVTVQYQPPCDQVQHPQFDQHKRNIHRIQPNQTELTMRDVQQSRWCERKKSRDKATTSSETVTITALTRNISVSRISWVRASWKPSGTSERSWRPSNRRNTALPWLSVDAINATGAIASWCGFPDVTPTNWRGIFPADRQP